MADCLQPANQKLCLKILFFQHEFHEYENFFCKLGPRKLCHVDEFRSAVIVFTRCEGLNLGTVVAAKPIIFWYAI